MFPQILGGLLGFCEPQFIRSVRPGLSDDEVNGQAWQMGYEQLLRAIDDDTDYVFETTLGCTSICDTLHEVIQKGRSVRIFFCGLSSLELHIQRVAERVAVMISLSTKSGSAGTVRS